MTSQAKPANTDLELPMVCNACKSYAVIYFRQVPDGFVGIGTNYLRTIQTNDNRYFAKIGMHPKKRASTTPAYLPDNVKRAYQDAEKARDAGLFGPAAACYRKAVERAVIDLLPDEKNPPTLGKKLSALEKLGTLPDTMLDWIRVIKDDGNFALHEDDRDFEEEAEILPARRFTTTLLEYLYTLPEEVKRARDSTDAPQSLPEKIQSQKSRITPTQPSQIRKGAPD